MEHVSTSPIAAERHEVLPPPTLVSVEVNSYRTRGEPIAIEIDGTTSQWHSVKGGLQPNATGIQEEYEVLYNPEKNIWLKVIPPNTRGLL